MEFGRCQTKSLYILAVLLSPQHHLELGEWDFGVIAMSQNIESRDIAFAIYNAFKNTFLLHS